jgi:hypothetical protein
LIWVGGSNQIKPNHLIYWVQAVNLCSLEHRAKIESTNYRYAVKATLDSNARIASHEEIFLYWRSSITTPSPPPRYATTRLVLCILQREIGEDTVAYSTRLLSWEGYLVKESSCKGPIMQRGGYEGEIVGKGGKRGGGGVAEKTWYCAVVWSSTRLSSVGSDKLDKRWLDNRANLSIIDNYRSRQ